MGFTSYANGSYVAFDVTVASNGQHPDPLSPRMIKQDYENRFYATPTWFSNSGEIRGYSKNLGWTSTSYPVSLNSNAIGVRQDNPYLGDPPTGQYCYLETYWGSSSTTNQLRVLGRYTP